jgi:hypothetical protein
MECVDLAFALAQGDICTEVYVMMQCYEHAKANVAKDAVAICSNCGAALCMEHLVEHVEVSPDTNQRRRQIVCQTCAETKKR